MSIEQKKISFWYRLEKGNSVEIQEVTQKLGLDPLIIEDMLNENHLPKVEIYEHLVFLIARIFLKKEDPSASSLIYIILGEGFVVSLESDFSFLNTQLKQMKASEKIYRSPESLFLLLCDITVDTYLPVSGYLRREVDLMEEEALEQPGKDFSVRFQQLYRTIGYCRRAVSLLHEDFMRLRPVNTSLISKSSQSILNDIQDHLRSAFQTLETNASLLISIRGLFQDTARQKQSEIIQHLTFVTSIFIPLSFITGVYGMNFVDLPFLQTPYGYLVIVGIMILIALAMWLFFKRRLEE